MLITNHWSASAPVRLRAYHIEIARKAPLSESFLHDLRALAIQPTGHSAVPWNQLLSYFWIWKNDSLTTATDYGTWDLNTDPRDGSPNIEVASCCMEEATTDNFGVEPFTIVHAWLHAGVCARICSLKGLSTDASFEPTAGLQNGPIYVISTHGERAIQTVDYGVPGGNASSLQNSETYGYFVGSGDPDSRWDLAILDPAFLGQGQQVSVEQAKASAAWIRAQAHAIKAQAEISGYPAGYWGLDGEDTP